MAGDNRYNISFGQRDEEYRKKLKPFLDRHQGNFSAAIKDIIDFADSAVTKAGSLDRAKEALASQSAAGLRPGDLLVLNIKNVAATLTFHAPRSEDGLVLNIEGIVYDGGSKQ